MKISNQLVPAFASTLLARIALGVGVSTAAIALTPSILPQPASAQTAPGTPGNVQPFPDSSRQNERDTFGGNIGGGDFSVFNLIHRAQLGNGSFDEKEVNRSMDNGAEAFKRRQRQLLEHPQQKIPETPATNLQQEKPQENRQGN